MGSPSALGCLSSLSDVVGRLQVIIGRRILPSPPLQAAGRIWLRRLLAPELPRPDDVTVVIGVRDRVDYRLTNALESLRAQSHPAESTRITVVDYGSGADHAERLADICAAHGAECVRVANAGVWSRARCLNVGIRRCATKYLLVSDVDIVFSPDYLGDAVRVLSTSPLSVVCSEMLDLPEETASILERAADEGEELQTEAWKQWARPRFDGIRHPSICMTYAAVHRAVRGFDEYFQGWGLEDDDLLRRFVYLGLAPTLPGTRSFYLHQWHGSDQRGIEGNEEQVRRNEEYYRRCHSILRNGGGWGRGGVPADPGGGGRR